eukprot:1446159-Pyramimonas_sp.AAC.1
MWRTPPGARDPVAPQPGGATVEIAAAFVAANAVADPVAITSAKAKKWRKIWAGAVGAPSSIAQALRHIRQKAAEGDIPPLQIEQLQAAGKHPRRGQQESSRS